MMLKEIDGLSEKKKKKTRQKVTFSLDMTSVWFSVTFNKCHDMQITL